MSEHEHEVEHEKPADDEWDGVPKTVFTHEQRWALFALAPHWQAFALGPKVPFSSERANVNITNVLAPDRQTAEELMWVLVEGTCDNEGLTFDREEWTLYDLTMVGGS